MTAARELDRVRMQATQMRSLPFNALLIVLILNCTAGWSICDEGKDPSPTDYRSANFRIHTDLSRDEAEELLERLESMLKIVSKYWGAPAKKTIECYVVDDINNWPDGSLHPQSISHVQQGGITVAQGVRVGRQFNMNAVVYASAKFGTPQHEAVHAFCYQTFGLTGPTWYAEGMAEMGNYWIEDDPAVNCPQYVIDFLKQSRRPSLSEITAEGQQTGDGWRAYAWRWALCHFLAGNPNYSDRFRVLGVSLLTGRGGSFDRSFESQMDELEFEFTFFLDHLEQGFDVARCSWDWKARYREPRATRPITSKIKADRGWQPSGLKVTAGTRYQFACNGKWAISDDAPEHGAEGDPSGAGRLIGCLMNDQKLGQSFQIPLDQPWAATADGQLVLRCEDSWNSLSDNSGSLDVSIALDGP